MYSTTHFVSVIFMLLLYHTNWCCCRRLDNNQVPVVENNPTRCTAVSLSRDSLHVSWCSSDDHDTAVKSGSQFEVYVNSDVTCKDSSVRQEPLRTTKCEETLQGICAGGNHSISVYLSGVLMFECTLLSSAGQSSPPFNLASFNSERVHYLYEVQQLKSNAPGRPVKFRVSEVKSTEVNVTWEKPVESEEPPTFYKLVWIWDDGLSSSNSPNGDKTNYLITGLKPYTNYSLFLAGCNVVEGKLYCGENSTTNVATKIAAPGKPTSLKVISATNTTIVVEWKPPIVTNGPLNGYTIVFTEKDSEKEIIKKELTDNKPFTGEGLKLRTSYIIAVSAYNNPDDGTVDKLKGEEESISWRTGVAVPGKPSSLTIANKTRTTIKITWKPPVNPNGPINGYLISVTDQKSKNFVKENTTTETFFEILDLVPWTNYSISVRAYTDPEGGGDKLVGEEATINGKTRVAGPKAPGLLKVTNFTSTTIDVEWKKPVVPNGPLDGYFVVFTDDKGWFLEDNTSSTQYKAEGLKPWTRYYIAAAAYNMADDGSGALLEGDAAEIYEKTEIAVPGKPGNVTLSANGSTEMQVSWTKPKVNPGPTEYKLKVTRYQDSTTGNGDQVQLVGCDKLNDWAIEKCKISRLEPYTFYSAQLTASTEKGESEAVSSSRQRTLQELPDVSKMKMPDVPNSENVAQPTLHSVEFEIPLVKFPASKGPVTLTVIVAGEGLMAEGARQGSETLAANPLPAFNKDNPTYLYRASPENWNPFPATQYQAAEKSGLPCKFIPEKEISICELGTQGDCQKATTIYCNGALTPNTKYLVKIRAYTDSGWAETNALKVRTKSEDSSEDGPNVLGIVLGVVFGALFLLTLVLLFVFRARISSFIQERRR